MFSIPKLKQHIELLSKAAFPSSGQTALIAKLFHSVPIRLANRVENSGQKLVCNRAVLNRAQVEI